MVAHGLPAPLAQVYAAFDTAIARGELAATSDTVPGAALAIGATPLPRGAAG